MAKSSKPKAYLIASDDAQPAVSMTSGKRFDVRTVQVVDPSLKPSGKMAARLCGSTSTCVALIEVED